MKYLVAVDKLLSSNLAQAADNTDPLIQVEQCFLLVNQFKNKIKHYTREELAELKHYLLAYKKIFKDSLLVCDYLYQLDKLLRAMPN